MANRVKSYFLPPEWVYQPGGPIFLGSIISDPRQPEESLNASNKSVAAAIPLVLDITKTDYRSVIDNGKEHTVGLDVSVLSIFGAGGSVGVSRGKQTVYTLSAGSLVTQEINPDLAYINIALAEPSAVQFLSKKKFKANVYCVTGIMIGKNVKIESYEAKDKGFDGSLGVSAAALGAPVEVGPKYSNKHSNKTTVASKFEGELILGYRLRRITYKRRSKHVEMDQYRKGALLAENLVSLEDDNPVEYFAKAMELDEDEITSEDFEFESVMMGGSRSGSPVELVAPIDA